MIRSGGRTVQHVATARDKPRNKQCMRDCDDIDDILVDGDDILQSERWC